jgi:hypothetical protein
METAFGLTPRAHLLLAVAALEFAWEQPAGSAATRKKIELALASARRDLARLKRGRRQKRK